MPQRPSLLPPSSSRKRSGSSGLFRPMRLEVAIGAATALVILALPLYLWRRPAAMDGGGKRREPALAESEASLLVAPREPEPQAKVTLGEVRTLSCKGLAGSQAERCDRLPFFEEGLTKAIVENSSCAPISSSEESVSFVLTVDFSQKKLHLWPGRSGSLRRPRANDLVRCVLRDIPTPEWSTLPHQHRRYEIGVMATYRPR